MKQDLGSEETVWKRGEGRAANREFGSQEAFRKWRELVKEERVGKQGACSKARREEGSEERVRKRGESKEGRRG